MSIPLRGTLVGKPWQGPGGLQIQDGVPGLPWSSQALHNHSQIRLAPAVGGLGHLPHSQGDGVAEVSTGSSRISWAR